MSILKRAAIGVAAIVTAVASTTFATATPSFAASDIDAWADCMIGSFNWCGQAHFVADAGDGNERLDILDGMSDGYGIAVENYRYDLSDIGPYWGWNRDGADTTTHYTLHITEGARFEMRICPEQNGSVLYNHCSAWTNGYA